MSPLLDSIVTWRITWSLAQSLWLGALLVAAVWVVDRLLQRRGAEARYQVHLAALLLLGASLPVFYAWAPFAATRSPPSPLADAESLAARDLAQTANEGATEFAADERMTVVAADSHERAARRPAPSSGAPEAEVREHSVGELLRVASPWIAGGYFVGVLLMLARLVLAVWGSRRLRRASTVLAEGELPAGFARRCRRMGLRFAPVVARCERVGAPVVIGMLRPMILVPSTLLTGLVPDQLLEVLAHELAHLRRYDHWALLAQRAVEVLLFFHPAAWWLSRRVEELRELNCDDRVVAAGSDPLDYVAALVRVAELSLAGADRRASLASLAADGASPSRLRRRIARLLGAREEPSVRLSGGACAAIVMAVAALFAWLAPSAPGPVSRTSAAERQPVEESTDDSSKPTPSEPRPAPRQTIAVRGEVKDEAGRPAERDLEVVAHEQGRILGRTRTDELGRFAFRELSVFRLSGEDWRSRVQFIVEIPNRRFGVGSVPVPKRVDGEERTVVEPAVHEVRIELMPCTAELEGQVVDRNGRPLVGARVRSYGWFPWSVGDDWPAPQTVTDEQGKYTLRLPNSRFHDLSIVHPAAASTILSRGSKTEQVVLGAAGAIAGRVVARDSGRPLSGVPLRARSLVEREGRRSIGSTLTDDQGGFQIRGLPPGHYSVHVGVYDKDVRLVPVLPRPVLVKPDETTQIDVPFVLGRPVRGRVVEAPGDRPVGDVVVAATVGSHSGPSSDRWGTSGETAADGAFELFVPAGVCELKAFVPAAAPYRPSHEESARSLEIEADSPPLDVVLKVGRVDESTRPRPGGFFGGTGKSAVRPSVVETPRAPAAPPLNPKLTFRLRTDQPVGEHVVRVVFRNSQSVNEWSLVSGATFEKEFTTSEIGRFARLLIDVPGFAPVETPEFKIAPNLPPVELDLPSARIVPVQGRVIGEDGEPIVGARIQVRRVYYGRDTQFPWGVESTTDAAGRFVLGRLRAGERITVVVTGENADRLETEPIRIESVERLELAPISLAAQRERIAGTIVDQDGLPVPKAEVSLARDPRVRAVADEQGRFELTGLPKGRSELKLRGPEGDETRRMAESGTLDAWLSLRIKSLYDRPAHVLQVTLRAPVDAPPVKAKMFVVDRAKERWILASEGGVDAVKSLDLGSAIRTSPERRFALAVLAPGFARVGPLPITVEPQVAPLAVDLRPAPTGKLTGRVVDENGRGIPFASVGLSTMLAERIAYEPWRFISNAPEPVPTTDENGRFELTDLPQGSEVRVYVNATGRGGAWSKLATIDSQTPTVLADVVLRKATRTVRGRVVTGDGRPLAEARVRVHDFARVETTTGADGAFEMKEAPDGELLLVAGANGYESTNRKTPAEGPGDVELKLRRDSSLFGP